MSRGKGRQALLPRTIAHAAARPGLSPGERRRRRTLAMLSARGVVAAADSPGGRKRSKRRAKIAKASRRRNR